MMKKHNTVYLILSILEGMLSGGYFYLAKREQDSLHLLTGCVWLACSVFHGLLGIREDEIIVLEDTDDE